MPKSRIFAALALTFFVSWAGLGLAGCSSAPQARTAAQTTKKPASLPSNQELVEKWCEELRPEIRQFGWDLDPCEGIPWKTAGRSVRGRELIYGEFGNPNTSNTTLILSMVHGDEVTPLYLALQLAHWLKDHVTELSETRVLIAPLVNPDSFYSKPRTRVNANGVDVNRNFETNDWKAHALSKWKKKYRSNPRRFPGWKPNSEPETRFQLDLINVARPAKILSIHAPLNFFDYDGPTTLSLMRFPKEYVNECIKLRKELKAIHFGFYPGSLGNYAGNQMGIPTVTLELPTANEKLAPQYWEKFQSGIKTMIEFEVPDVVFQDVGSEKERVTQREKSVTGKQ